MLSAVPACRTEGDRCGKRAGLPSVPAQPRRTRGVFMRLVSTCGVYTQMTGSLVAQPVGTTWVSSTLGSADSLRPVMAPPSEGELTAVKALHWGAASEVSNHTACWMPTHLVMVAVAAEDTAAPSAGAGKSSSQHTGADTKVKSCELHKVVQSCLA